jgi:hypothetical protein
VRQKDQEYKASLSYILTLSLKKKKEGKKKKMSHLDISNSDAGFSYIIKWDCPVGNHWEVWFPITIPFCLSFSYENVQAH